jgi:hypothetical protein
MSEHPITAPALDVLDTLRDPATIRLRCAAITAAVADGRSGWFTLDRSRLDATADRVVATMRRRFPDGRIPFHSRWRHFEAGGVNRKAEIDAAMQGRSSQDALRAMVDLAVVSVLLDAGAGPNWSYTERRDAVIEAAALPLGRQRREDLLAMLDAAAGKAAALAAVADEVAAETTTAVTAPVFTRSEGLGVASFRAFAGGIFSAQADDPWRADAATLKLIDSTTLRSVFQVGNRNPMVGLEGRAGLLSRLGTALAEDAHRFGCSARPSRVVERVTQGFTRRQISAAELLQEVLRAFGPIWTSGSLIRGVCAGDVWSHRWAGDGSARGSDPYTAGWVPFHKLSQWLTYSLLEPLQWAGFEVTELGALTGLPEYRNGGLLLDMGVIVPRALRDLEQPRKPSDELVIEWRALTVTLLDDVAERVRARLGKSESELPLACVLEGGTWSAGREIAADLRGGAPPIRIDSDGTVF